MNRPNYLVVITLLFFIPSVVHAIEKIKPDIFISLKAEYDDNVFFKLEPKTDFITTIIPGINTMMIAANWLHEIDYRIRFLDYRNIKRKSVNHNLNLIGRHKLANKFLFSIQGNLIEDKQETVEEDFSVTKREYLKQKIATAIRFQLKSRLETDIRYQYEDFNIREEEKGDSKEDEIACDIHYILSDRLKAIGVYQYRKRNYKNRGDLTRDLFGMGLGYELSPRINSKLVIEHETVAQGGKDSNAFAFQVNFNHQLNEKTTSYLTFAKDTEFSRSLTNSVNVTSAKINIIRELNEKTNLNILASSMHGNWQDNTRKDTLQTIILELSYQLSKDISFNINYNYIYRKSNIFEKCRRNNTYTFTIQVR
ncbi:MAG: hypothetical protein AB1567_02640 [bacterium]